MIEDNKKDNDSLGEKDEGEWQPIICVTDTGESAAQDLEVIDESFIYSNINSEEQIARSYKNNLLISFLFDHQEYQKRSSTSQDDGDNDDKSDEGSDNFISYNDQLAYTRSLLEDNEKFGYVGAVSVLTAQFCTQLAKLITCLDIRENNKLARNINKLQKDLAKWRGNLLRRLFEDLDLNAAEIKMIEQLDLIDVELGDICRNLKTNEIEKRTNVVDIAWSIICHLFLILTSEDSYDSRDRTLLIQLAKILGINHNQINDFEKRMYDTIDYNQDEIENDSVQDTTDHVKKRGIKNDKKKMAYVGLAMVGGSVLLGLSGGLLAPIIGASLASGFSTLGLGGAAGFISSAAGTATVAITSTAVGANIGAKSMNKRLGNVKTFEIKPIHNNSRVNLILTVPGWMNSDSDDIRMPFTTIDCIEGDIFALNWEPEILTEIGMRMKVATSEVVANSIQQMLGNAILVSFVSAIQLPLIFSRLKFFLDNPWAVASDRAWITGLILADTLMNKNLGNRPVTLVGYSMGARVIYSCLLELFRNRKLGLVENVYLFGAPAIIESSELVMARSVVSGRFVNGYSDKDWILQYLYRLTTSSGYKKVFGITKVDESFGIENIDCSELVNGHSEYRSKIPKLMELAGLETTANSFYDPVAEEELKSSKLTVDEVIKELQEPEKSTSTSTPLPESRPKE